MENRDGSALRLLQAQLVDLRESQALRFSSSAPFLLSKNDSSGHH